MTSSRLRELTDRYDALRVVVLGDFCLDRYLEIDPARAETSIETGLPVRNVVAVRAQPGGAGTVLNNLAALGVGEILPVGFCGEDGEGFELRRALDQRHGVNLSHFLTSSERRTFTYCKPLIVAPGQPPVELNRLDSKNWTPTPEDLAQSLSQELRVAARGAHALIVMEQVSLAGTGVWTRPVSQALQQLVAARADLLVIADSRRGLAEFPGLTLKMNAAELIALWGSADVATVPEATAAARALAARQGRPVFVTLAEKGILGANPGGLVEHVHALPVRGPIDIVGAGDSVTANLGAALAAGASLRDAMELAAAAASVVIHKLGTTGTANRQELESLILGAS